MIKLLLGLLISCSVQAQQTVYTNYLGLQPGALPSLCNQGAVAFSSGSSTLNVCSSTNNWTSFGISSTSPMTTAGDMIYENSSLVPSRLAVGSGSSILGVSGGIPTWVAPPSSSPLTTKGDLYGYSTSSVRLPIGATSGNFLGVDPGSSVGFSWQAILASEVPLLNQNTTGTAGNITATSNSTLTTLSALSLPGSQVTGNISGSAGSVSGSGVITNSNLATMAPYTVKGNSTASTASPTDMTEVIIGAPGFSDTGVMTQLSGSTNGYLQTILQNKSNGSSASADMIVNNNNGTATTNYGDFGINSSTFSGTGSLNLPSAAYVYSQSSDLVLATAGASTIHFLTNSSITDAFQINSSNSIVTPGLTGYLFGNAGSAVTASSTIPANTALASQVPLANGGTGINAGSTTGLFSSLSPLTTKGDLLTIGTTVATVRFPVGATAGLVLHVDSGSSTGISWGSNATTTGIIPLSNGGTGINAGSTTGLFSSLSPFVTKGDLLGVGTTVAAVRLPIGATAGLVLGVDAGSSVGFSWQTLSLATGVTGVLPLANGGTSINAGSTTGLFSSLSPLRTKGDLVGIGSTVATVRFPIGATAGLVLGVDSGSSVGFSWQSQGAPTFSGLNTDGVMYASSASVLASTTVGSTGQVLTSNGAGSAPTFQASSSSPTGSYAQAYFSSASSWSTASTTFADPTNSGGNALTVRYSSGITLTAAGSSLPGITFTPASSNAIYFVEAKFYMSASAGNYQLSAQLTDGSVTIDDSASGISAITGGEGGYYTVGGIYKPGTSSPVTVKVQLASADAGTITLSNPSGTGTAMAWTIFRIF